MSENQHTPSDLPEGNETMATRRAPHGRPGTISSGERLCRPVPASYAPKERRKHAIALRPQGIPVQVLIEKYTPEHEAWRVESQRKRNERAAALLKLAVA